jgi:hypothetical protein
MSSSVNVTFAQFSALKECAEESLVGFRRKPKTMQRLAALGYVRLSKFTAGPDGYVVTVKGYKELAKAMP